MRSVFAHLRLVAVLFVLLLAFNSVACEEEEAGFGTVILHVQLDTGGAAAGVQTYLVSNDQELHKTTDQAGNATYEQVPAGSWDAGFFEDTIYSFAAGQPPRKTIDVENDKTTEIQLVVKKK